MGPLETSGEALQRGAGGSRRYCQSERVVLDWERDLSEGVVGRRSMMKRGWRLH